MVESAGLVARAAGAEEEAQSASVATADWTIAPTPTPIPPDTTDAELVALWLHGKSPNTIRAYGDDVAAFRRFTGKPLRATYLSDLQRYADSLVGAPATRGRRLKTLKSLLSFATRMGYLPFNAGAAIHGPRAETGREDPQRAPSVRVARGGRRSAAGPCLDPPSL